MLVKKNLFSIVTIVFGVITVFLAVLALKDYVSVNLMMPFLAGVEIFGGLSQISMSKQINLKGKKRGSKNAAIFSIVVGIFIIFAWIKIVYV